MTERTTLTLYTIALKGQVVRANDHVLRRNRDRSAVSRRQNVVRRKHEDPGFGLSLGAERKVHCHLVTVEVGVECRANERVELDGLALNEDGLERLDTEAVKGRSAVQQNRVFLDDFFEHVPDLRASTLHHALG